MNLKLSVIFAVVFLTACASKDVVDNIDSLPPTAAGEQNPELTFWSNIGGKAVRSLTRHSRYPAEFDSADSVTQLDFPESKGDNYGQRISGLLTPPATGSYVFYVSADESAEVWLSTDEMPLNKRLVALVNKPSGYMVFDRYSSQKSKSYSLEQGKQYFFEVIHKDATGGDYLNVSWTGPGIALTTLTSEHLKAYQHQVVSGDAFYQEGYHAGYQSGSNLVPYDLTYPTPDADGDGLPDFYEAIIGLDSSDPSDAQSDADEDLLSALDEYLLRTNPLDADSDSDGLPDGFEVIYDLSAVDPSDALSDMDGDGVSNLDEYLSGSLVDDSTSTPAPVEEPVEPTPEPTPEPVVTTREVLFKWSVPDSREDGGYLPVGDIKEYRIYAGETSNSMSVIKVVEDPSATGILISNVDLALIYFEMSTVSVDGQESARSTLVNLLDPPSTEEPVTEEPVVSDPVTEEPAPKDPVVEEPVVTDPVVEDPVVEEPIVEDPVVEEPVAQEPPVEEEPVAGGTVTKYAIEQDSSRWVHTARSNSTDVDEGAFALSGGVLSSATADVNIHSHFISDDPAADACQYEGRMKLSGASDRAGLGVTFASDYPNSDRYYRFRYDSGSNNFHISPHGTTVSGDTTSGVAATAGQWYRFKILWQDTGSSTVIKAKAWADGSAEPAVWLVDAVDSNAGRFTNCIVGVWSMYAAGNSWDDLSLTHVEPAAMDSDGDGYFDTEDAAPSDKSTY